MAEIKRAYFKTSLTEIEFKDASADYKSFAARACKRDSGDEVEVTVSAASDTGKIILPGETTYSVEVVFCTGDSADLIAKFADLKPPNQEHHRVDVTWVSGIPERDPPPPPPNNHNPAHSFDPATAQDI